jgi:hypothetical protein
MIKNILIVMATLLLSGYSLAQQNSKPCSSAEYRQFDFWLGDWEVFNKKGDKVGENKIHTVQDGCALQENWTSKGQTGTSFNYYNTADSTWNQIYLDNIGTVLELKGVLKNNKMILRSKMVKSVKANFYYYNQIVWEKDSQGNVSQKWDIVDDKGNILQVAFDGVYKLKAGSTK